MPIGHKTCIKINTAHLRHNVKVLKKHLGPYFFCPVVKVNAYGHGLPLIARCLESENIDAFCVSSFEEGVQVRRSLYKPIPILVFTADYNPDEVRACREYHLTPVIGQTSDLFKFQDLRHKLDVHLKFNTGLNCYGFSTKDAQFVKDYLMDNPFLKVTGIATHLAQSYDAGQTDGCTAMQEKEFSKVQRVFGEQNYHYQNSACLLLQGNIGVGGRPGLALYGILPYTHRSVKMDLKPVMSFQTQVISIRHIEKGMSVSYEHQWTAQRKSIIGLIPIGYADALKRNLEGRQIHFLIKGQLAPLIGVIRMNCCLLDLTDVKGHIEVGERVVIFGESEDQQLSIKDLASQSGLTPYEMFTSIRSDIPRQLADNKEYVSHFGEREDLEVKSLYSPRPIHFDSQ